MKIMLSINQISFLCYSDLYSIGVSAVPKSDGEYLWSDGLPSNMRIYNTLRPADDYFYNHPNFTFLCYYMHRSLGILNYMDCSWSHSAYICSKQPNGKAEFVQKY